MLRIVNIVTYLPRLLLGALVLWPLRWVGLSSLSRTSTLQNHQGADDVHSDHCGHHE